MFSYLLCLVYQIVSTNVKSLTLEAPLALSTLNLVPEELANRLPFKHCIGIQFIRTMHLEITSREN